MILSKSSIGNFVVLFGVLLTFTEVSVAQSGSLWIGAGSGYGLSRQTIANPGLTCTNDTFCAQYTGGNGGGILASISADWRSADWWGILVRAGYWDASVPMVASVANGFVKDASGNIVPLVRTQTLSTSRTGLSLDLLPELRVGVVRFFVGAQVRVPVGSSWQASSSIVSPSNVTFQSGVRDTQFLANTKIPSTQSLLFGVIGGVGVDIPLSARLSFSPEVSIALPLNSIRTDISWQESTIGLLASLRYNLNPQCKMEEEHHEMRFIDTLSVGHPDAAGRTFVLGISQTSLDTDLGPCTRIITDRVRRTDTLFTIAPPVVPLAATLTIDGIDSSGQREDVSAIHVQVQFVTEAFPLLPFVFFDRTSSTLPERYQQVSSPRSFNIDHLSPDARSLHYALLNILGARLRDNPSTTLTIHGYADKTSEGGNCGLAAARANEVKAYLNRVWGIEDARVRIETSTGNCAPTDATQTGTEAGYEENRRVGFSSNDPVILAPVIRNRFLEPVLVSPSGIELTAHIPADLQVATWNEHADANGTTLTQSGGRSVSKPVDHQFTDDDVRDISKGDAITGTLNIDDIQGHASRASASLPIILDTLPISVQRLTLTLFQISQDRIRPTDEPPLRQFFQDLKPTDELSIKGYTDDIGGLDLNMKLSGQRAESVRAFYGRESGLGKILFSGGVGPTQRVRGVTGYTTPEERFLSRTVAIEIRRHM